MNCLDFRRAVLADPDRIDAAMAMHAAQCPACAQFRAKSVEWEADLAAALRVPVPEGVRHRLPRRATSARRTLAVLAYALGILAAGGLALSLGWTRDDPLALAGIDFVVFDEAQAILYAKTAEPGMLGVAAARLDIALPERLGETRYVCTLPFGDGMAYHLVLRSAFGKATLMLLPGRPPARRAKASARGLTAVVVPTAGGSVTVIARSSQSVERIAQALASQGGS